MKVCLTILFFILIQVIGFSQKIETRPPDRAIHSIKSKNTISYIFVPVRIKMGELTSLISMNLPRTYSGSISKIKEGKYKVYLGHLSPIVKRNDLSFNIDYLEGIASGVLGVTVSGQTAGVSANINSLSGAINLHPNLSVEGYNLKTKLKMDNHVDHAELQACKYIGWPINKNMCSISVPVTSMVDQSIEKQINESRSSIERSIQTELNKLDLKKTAGVIWRGFYNNTRIDTGSNDLWLLSRPKRVFMGDLNFTKEYVEFGVGLNLAVRVDSSAFRYVKSPLPKPIRTSRKKGFYQCMVPGFVSYEYLETYMNKKYEDYIIMHEGKKFMKLKEIKIYGSKDNELIVGFRIDGVAKSIKKARGWIYVRAEIELHENDYMMKVKSYDLDAKTNNFLLNNGLELMANKTHYKRFLADLKYDMKPQLSKYHKEVNAYLKKGYKTAYGPITGSLNEMAFSNFKMGPNGVTVNAKLMGKLNPFYIDLIRHH